jgi:PST family polysaccharide transporter
VKTGFIGAFGWSVASEAGNHILSLAFVMILARLLLPEDFGIVAALSLFLTLGLQASIWGIDRELMQRQEAGDAEFSTGFWLVLPIALGVTLGLMLISPVVGMLTNMPEAGPVLRLLSVTVLFQALTQILISKLIKEMKLARYASLTLLARGLAGSMAILLALAGFGVYALVAQQLVFSILSFLLALTIGGWLPRFQFRKKVMAELLAYGLPMTGSNLLTVFNRESPKFIVGVLLGSTALGYFALAMRVVDLLTSLAVLTYSRVAIPVFVRLKKFAGRLADAFLVSVRLIATLLLPAFAITAILSDDLVQILFGPEWTSSGPVLSVLALAGILIGFNYINGSVLISMGQPSVRFWMTVLRAVVGTVALIILAPRGLLWAAAALVVRGLVVEPVQLAWVLRLLGLTLYSYLVTLRVSLAGTLILVLVCFTLRYYVLEERPLMLAAVIAASVSLLAYGFWLYFRDPKLHHDLLTKLTVDGKDQ